MCAFFSVPFQCWRASTDKSPNATGLLITWNAQVGQNTKQEGGQEPTVPPYAYSTAQIRPLKPPTSHIRACRCLHQECIQRTCSRLTISFLPHVFSARYIGLVLPLEMPICFVGTRLAPHRISSSRALFNSSPYVCGDSAVLSKYFYVTHR